MAALQEFITQAYTRGLARSNRFLVTFDRDDNADDLRLLQFFCDSTDLPGVSIESNQNLIFGEQRDLPYNRTFGSISLSFHVDAELRVKQFFDKWIDKVIDPTTRTQKYYNDFVKTVRIQIIDETVTEENFSPYGVTLYEVWPKSIQPFQLSNRSSDSFLKLNVTLVYKYWLPTVTPRPN